MYYRLIEQTKDLALSNGQEYHLASLLIRGKSIIREGTNQQKTHPAFQRKYKDGSTSAHLHAESDVLRFSQPGDTLIVARFSKRGEMTMAKPCPYCCRDILRYEIDKVYFTNWDGKLVKMKKNEIVKRAESAPATLT